MLPRRLGAASHILLVRGELVVCRDRVEGSVRNSVRERIEIHDHRWMINLSWKCCLGTKPIRAAKHYTALPVGLGKQLGCRLHPGGGLSVDASVRIEGPDHDSLERLLRYCALAGFTHSLSRGNTSRPLSSGIEGP